jgi:hypothetical protein
MVKVTDDQLVGAGLGTSPFIQGSCSMHTVLMVMLLFKPDIYMLHALDTLQLD